MCRNCFLIVTALAEAGIGLVLVVAPSVPLALLLGVDQASTETTVTARIAGAALLALGVVCWPDRGDRRYPARKGMLLGILLYDLAAAGILADTAYYLSVAGIALWPAVGLHVALAVWCVACICAVSPDPCDTAK
jgi:hypothetical protein